MSKVFGGDYVVSGGTVKRVINTNDIIAKKLEEITKEAKEAKILAEREEYKKNRIAEMQEAGEIPEGEEGEAFIAGIMADEITLDLPDDIELKDLEAEEESPEEETSEVTSEMAEKLLSEAQAEAARITNEAYEEAEVQKKLAYDAGLENGYNDGVSQARQEYEEKLAQLENERVQLEEEFARKEAQLEPDLLDAMLDIFAQAFKVQFAGKRDLILHIVDNAIRGIKDSKNFKIHVSEEDLTFVREHKEALITRLGDTVEIEIIADADLGPGGCLIDADSGIYECSIDTQLDNLCRDLRTLSLA